MSAPAAGTASVPSTTFQGAEDLYGGFIIDADTLPSDNVEFTRDLANSLEAWRQCYGGIWLKIPLARSECVPLAVAQGFQFHHAEAGYVMMTHWLKASESTLPPNASHQVGAGAVVLNSKGELLVVRERHGPAGKLGVWKLPTGLVHAGEDIPEGIVREVMEETGLETEFDQVLAVRQAHGIAFGKSDMFFCCALRPTARAAADCTPDGRPRVQPCLKEVEAARWLPLQEYCESDFVRSRPTLATLAKCMTAYADGTYHGYRTQSVEGRRRELLMFSESADSVMPRGWENC